MDALRAALPAGVPQPRRRDHRLPRAGARARCGRSSTSSCARLLKRLEDRKIRVELTERGQGPARSRRATIRPTARVRSSGRSSAGCSTRWRMRVLQGDFREGDARPDRRATRLDARWPCRRRREAAGNARARPESEHAEHRHLAASDRRAERPPAAAARPASSAIVVTSSASCCCWRSAGVLLACRRARRSRTATSSRSSARARSSSSTSATIDPRARSKDGEKDAGPFTHGPRRRSEAGRGSRAAEGAVHRRGRRAAGS